MLDHRFGIESLRLHTGELPRSVMDARAVPIYPSPSFGFGSPERAASLFNLQTFGTSTRRSAGRR